jgi:hypothetical protein
LARPSSFKTLCSGAVPEARHAGAEIKTGGVDIIRNV